MKESEPKAPAFMMYARDWLASMSIATMSLAAEATYVRLLCHQWLAMRLPSESHRVRMATRIGEAEWAAVWTELEPHFPEVEGGGRANPRLEAYRADMLAKKGVRSEAGKKGAAAKWHGDSKRDGNADGKRMANAKQNDGLAVAVAVAGKEPPISPTDDPQFVAAWAAYPKGKNDNRKKAERAYRATLGRGHAPADLLAGVQRYAAYLAVTTWRQPMHAATFFGPDEHWALPWEPEPETGKAGGFEVTPDLMRDLGLDPVYEAEQAEWLRQRAAIVGPITAGPIL